MHELSSAVRNARYRRFFELLNNLPGLYQVILNLLSESYRKIDSVMHKLYNRKVSKKHLLIMVNCFSLKRYIFNKRNNCTFMWDFKFSRRLVWCSELSSGIYCRVKWLSTDISEVRTASRRQFWTSYFYMFDVIMLFYISLPSWSNIKLCTMVDREWFSCL
jgi:hypothetical protein